MTVTVTVIGDSEVLKFRFGSYVTLQWCRAAAPGSWQPQNLAARRRFERTSEQFISQ
jgi:hypothetical protein